MKCLDRSLGCLRSLQRRRSHRRIVTVASQQRAPSHTGKKSGTACDAPTPEVRRRSPSTKKTGPPPRLDPQPSGWTEPGIFPKRGWRRSTRRAVRLRSDPARRCPPLSRVRGRRPNRALITMGIQDQAFAPGAAMVPSDRDQCNPQRDGLSWRASSRKCAQPRRRPVRIDFSELPLLVRTPRASIRDTEEKTPETIKTSAEAQSYCTANDRRNTPDNEPSHLIIYRSFLAYYLD